MPLGLHEQPPQGHQPPGSVVPETSIPAPNSAEVEVVKSENRPPDRSSLSIPIVRLDSDMIAPNMAACLANSLLGHMLFLKNQVPFPMVQLSRMPSSQANTRNSKKRVELLNVMDTLSSHLRTTFVALSSALAQGRAAATRQLPKVAECDSSPGSHSRTYMSFIVGPSPGASKAHVILIIDDLEVKRWDLRDDREAAPPEQDDSDAGASNIAAEEMVDDEADEVDDCCEDESDATEPPLSRSPSPSSPSSVASSPPPTPPRASPRRFGTPLILSQNSTQRALSVLSSQHSTPKSMPSPERSYAEDQQVLRAAERLLSRTLADANAEGNGLSTELAAAQTHVFLRAPRRFSHSAWKPRQNYTRSLENNLHTFMSEVVCQTKTPPKNKGLRSGAKTEGVWITCGSGSIEDASVDRDKSKLVEDDEMIWWEWNGGKIVGFSEW